MGWVIIFGLVGLGLLGLWGYLVLAAPKKDFTHPIDKILDAQQRANMELNPIARRAELRRSKGRTELNTQINTETPTYIEMINQQTAARLAEYENLMAVDRRQREDIILQAMQMNELLVIQAANEYRLSPDAYQQMMIESIKMGHQMMLKRSDQELEIQKHFQMKLIEHEVEKWTADLKKAMARYKRMLPYYQYEEINKMLEVASGNLDSYKHTQFPSPELKQRELARLESYVNTLKEKLDGWKNRLV